MSEPLRILGTDNRTPNQTGAHRVRAMVIVCANPQGMVADGRAWCAYGDRGAKRLQPQVSSRTVCPVPGALPRSEMGHFRVFAREFLSPTELAKRWHSSPGHLANLRGASRGPAYVKIGNKVLYDLADVEAYEQAGRVAA